MGMCPEGMERWGAASIFKESARLLHKHYRLFLPFFLAFYLPSSIAPVFETLSLSSPTTPLLGASIVAGFVNTTQTTDPPGGPSYATIFSWTLFFLIAIAGTLGTGAVFYITDYLYNPTDTDDDRSIVPRVFKFLPGAFLRMFITGLWAVLAYLLIGVFIAVLGGILHAMFVAAGWSNPNFLFLFCFFFTSAGCIYLGIVFKLAQVIAVLESGNYGRKALKRSTKLVRFGRVWTVVAVLVTVSLLSSVLTVPTNRIMSGEMPVWAKVVLGVVVGGVESVLGVYYVVVSAVMYFVYKARFDAAGSAGIPMLRRIDSAERSYDPIVEGKGSVTYIDQP